LRKVIHNLGKNMPYPKTLTTLINALRRFPGVGTRTAERYAFQMIEWQERHRKELTDAIGAVAVQLQTCSTCGCLRDSEECFFCQPVRASAGAICVIAHRRDAFTIEETGAFKGLYHVLGGLLSPIDGIDTEQLAIEALMQRIKTHQIQEVILALDATLEGDTTALYLKQLLHSLPVHVSRLAFGLPLGSAFSYVDGSTLARAFSGRHAF
jgi:recombination protein RecR